MKPDFLCIGAQKSATSWLYREMGRHPQIWVPPVKELNYFNNTTSTLYKRLFSKYWLNKNWRVLFNLKIIQPVFHGKNQEINYFRWRKYYRWCFKYFFLPRNFRWYISLFPHIPGKITGEFSVAYAVLGEPAISHMAKLLPDIKIIYLLRNPVDRTWSQTKMNLAIHAGFNLEELPDEKFFQYFENPYVELHSDYLTNLDTLGKYYPASQIFVGFFDEIKENPGNFLRKLFDFLQVEFPTHIYSKGIDKKSHVGIVKKIPDKFIKYLAEKYLQPITLLDQRFNNPYTKEWLDSTRQYLNESQTLHEKNKRT